MNFSDFIIIYLACGAPFGVYYFSQNRKALHQNQLWLNSFLTMTVWFPYAFRFLQEFITGKLNNYKFKRFVEAETARKNALDALEKQIAQLLLAENSSVSLFDFRETFQRYSGLTAAMQNAAEPDAQTENERELFRVAGNENVELGAKCLRRRNLNRLKFHQNSARQDLIEMFGAINAGIKESEKFRSTVTEFFTLLNDVEAENALGKIFISSSQTLNDFAVRSMEKELWKPKQDQPPLTSQKTLNLQTMSAAATIRKPE